MTRTSTWKSAERAIAKLLDGERVPVTGRQRGHAPDIAHPTLALEVKHRESIPLWLEDAVDQARKAVREDKTPVVIIHTAGQQYARSLAVVPLEELMLLIGRQN